MECSALALYTPLRPEEMSLPVRVFHFPGLPEHWQDVTIKQCFENNAGTGGSVWHASAQLSLYLASHLDRRHGKAIELGCGLGLVSIVMSILGFDVLATDVNEVVLGCAEENFRENGLTEGQTKTEGLLWCPLNRGDRTQIDKVLNTWGQFDVIVAADVLYGEYEHMDAFISTIVQLAKDDAELFIAQKVRYPEKEAHFRARLQEHFSLDWITSDLLCSNLGKQSIYYLKKLPNSAGLSL